MDSEGDAFRRHLDTLKRLRDDLQNRRLALIVGAGVTLGATVDDSGSHLSRIGWIGLMRNGLQYLLSEGYVDKSNRRIKRALQALDQEPKSSQTSTQMDSDLEYDIDSLFDVANILSNEMQKHGQFATWLESVFGSLSREISHPDVLEALKRLHHGGAILLTTNYDDVLETYCGLRRLRRSDQNDILKFRKHDIDGVFHIHGSYLDPDDVVFDIRNYYQVIQEDEAQAMLKAFMVDKTIVFVGYDGLNLQDPALDALLQGVASEQKQTPNRHCVLVPDGDLRKRRRTPLLRLRYGDGYQGLASLLNKILSEDNCNSAFTPLQMQRLPKLSFQVTPQNHLTAKYDEYKIGWICALPVEMAAARGMLDEEHGMLALQPFDTNTYVLGSVAGHNIVIACLPDGVPGTSSASYVACNMLRTFQSIRFGLMVGIGGGVPGKENDIRLGDVIVSRPSEISGGVVQYDYGKTLATGRFQRTGFLNRPPDVVLTALAGLRSYHLMTGKLHINDHLARMFWRHPEMKEKFTSPGTEKDGLFEAGYEHTDDNPTCDECDQSNLVKRRVRSTTEPQVFYGLIASGNQVIKHGTTRDRLGRELHVLCFEMEAAGLMNSFPCLLIRGISDYADSHKNKDWQPYAAASAAAFAKQLLSTTPVVQVVPK